MLHPSQRPCTTQPSTSTADTNQQTLEGAPSILHPPARRGSTSRPPRSRCYCSVLLPRGISRDPALPPSTPHTMTRSRIPSMLRTARKARACLCPCLGGCMLWNRSTVKLVPRCAGHLVFSVRSITTRNTLAVHHNWRRTPVDVGELGGGSNCGTTIDEGCDWLPASLSTSSICLLMASRASTTTCVSPASDSSRAPAMTSYVAKSPNNAPASDVEGTTY